MRLNLLSTSICQKLLKPVDLVALMRTHVKTLALATLAALAMEITVSAQEQPEGKEPVASSSDADDPNAEDDDPDSLELPERPKRKVPDTKENRPKAARPDRQQHRGTSSVFTNSRQQPIPANPGRNVPLPSTAEERDSEAESTEAEEPPGLLLRLPHEHNGITAQYIYTGEMFSNARGGLDTNDALGYRGNFDLVLLFDSGKMGLWEGGQFFLYGQNTHGKVLSTDYVGDVQYFSNIDSSPRPDLAQISEYWYRHAFEDDVLVIKTGKQDANADFAYVDLGGDFVHSSFGLIPTIPLPTFPAPALGVAGFWNVTKNLQVGGGCYDAGGQGDAWGFNTLGKAGSMTLSQLTYKSQHGPNGQLPGTFRLGGWYNSNPRDEITSSQTPQTYANNYGMWTSIDQMIFKESYGDDDTQGLGLFVQYGYAPPDRNEWSEYYGAGALYQGLFAGRDNDLTGVGVANLFFSPRLREIDGRTFETAIELFHKFRISPYLSIQPDMQFIANPGGDGRDALVPGGRFEVVF